MRSANWKTNFGGKLLNPTPQPTCARNSSRHSAPTITSKRRKIKLTKKDPLNTRKNNSVPITGISVNAWFLIHFIDPLTFRRSANLSQMTSSPPSMGQKCQSISTAWIGSVHIGLTRLPQTSTCPLLDQGISKTYWKRKVLDLPQAQMASHMVSWNDWPVPTISSRHFTTRFFNAAFLHRRGPRVLSSCCTRKETQIHPPTSGWLR